MPLQQTALVVTGYSSWALCMTVFPWVDIKALNGHSSAKSSQFTHRVVDLGSEEEVQLRPIFATMKKARLVILSILTTTIILCYRRYSLYSTNDKITSFDFGKLSCFQHANIALIIHAITIASFSLLTRLSNKTKKHA